MILYEFKISLKLNKTLKTIIDIAKQDRLKCCYKTRMIS